jgi:predicted metal-dependent hydrolase
MRNVRPELQRGIALFNAGEYFEAHEVLEAAWMQAAPADRFFLQSVIHMAVAWHHARRRNLPGALRQVDKGLKKLAGYLPRREQVETLALYRAALLWREAWLAGAEPAGRATIGVSQ